MRILMALSGGVDSAVAAARLRREGVEVIGVHLDMGFGDPKDAEGVGARLGIPVRVFEAGGAFEGVLDDFVGAYAAGRTPNPCVLCNRIVKFERLLEIAAELGADKIATGHYARTEEGVGGRVRLRRAAYRRKDQSYVLHRLTQAQLRHAVFPLGDAPSKDAIRREAAALGLEVAEKPESQDLCFAPDGDYRTVVRARAPLAFVPGEIFDLETERVVGRHDGTAGFTRGQRRGLPALGSPRYVAGVDPSTGRIEIAGRDALLRREVRVEEANWIEVDRPAQGGSRRVEAQIRHAGRAEAGRLQVDADGAFHVVFDQGVFAPAPGQALVAYEGDAVLAGGPITEKVPPEPERLERD